MFEHLDRRTVLEQLIAQRHGQAICYSGYRDGQDPRQGIYPSYEQIKEDLLDSGPPLVIDQTV